MANDRLRIAKLAFPCIIHGGSFRFSHSAHGGSPHDPDSAISAPRVQTPFAVIRNASPRDIAIMTLLNKLVGRHASLYAAFNSIHRVSYVPILGFDSAPNTERGSRERDIIDFSHRL